jgi:hypothetical protein
MFKETSFLIASLVSLLGCTPQEVQILDDFVEGEAQVAEKMISDTSGVQQRPQVNLIQKKF